MRSVSISILLCSVFLVLFECVSAREPTWRWSCENAKCVKKRFDTNSTEPALGLEVCKMYCNEYGLLWPRPTGDFDLGKTNQGNFLSKINIRNIKVKIDKCKKIDDLTKSAVQRFKKMVTVAIPKGVTPKTTGKSLDVHLINANPSVREFSLDMDESYSLYVGPKNPAANNVVAGLNATITANTFFGLRHGLETLSQLFVYDELNNQLLMVQNATVTDKPVYPYRGLLLDTSRNFYSVKSIKNTIDAMASVKLNTFHWHITDSQSFSFQSTRRPQLTKLGSLSPRKVYTKEVIKEIVQYGLERGVRVLPEFDAPAHVGEGWQDTDLTVCFKAEPWESYCAEPPCGQFNPTKDELYDYLQDIYTDMAESFQTTDIFHMGGDEVNDNCWNSSESIRNYMAQNQWDLSSSGYLQLWNYFQKKAQEKAYTAFGKKLPLILWTSTLTEYETIENYLNKDDYIIQVWTTGTDPQIQGLLQKGYRLIISNYDALYLTCGFASWVGSGNNWCSPYKEWQKVYDNSPAAMALQYKDLILGGEAALWSETSDTSSVDNLLWPRAAALAERLWAEPATTWLDAEFRMLTARERLVRMGIQADSIKPEWCYQNEGYCDL